MERRRLVAKWLFISAGWQHQQTTRTHIDYPFKQKQPENAISHFQAALASHQGSLKYLEPVFTISIGIFHALKTRLLR